LNHHIAITSSKSKAILPHRIMLVCLFLVAFFFGLQGIYSDSIRRDELTTLGHIGGLEEHDNGVSLIETFESLRTYSAQHPPLFYIVANLWGHSFTYSAYMMRLLPLLWGMLALAVVYRLARDIGGKDVGLVTVALLATSIVFIFYAHEIRQYTSLLFWNASVWLLYHRLHKQITPPKPYQLALLTLATTGAIFTHNTSIFLLLVIGLYHLLFAPKNRTWVMVSVAVAIAGVFYLPWLPSAIDGLQVTTEKLAIDDSKLLYNPRLIQVIPMFWGNGTPLLFLTLIGIGILGVVQNRRNSRYLLFFVVAFSAVVLAMNGYLEFVKRIRYVIVFLIPFTIFGAMGLVSMLRWRSITVTFLVIWIATGTWFQTQYDYFHHTGLDGALDHPEYYALMPFLSDEMSPDDILVMTVNDYEAIQPSKQGKKSIEQYYFDDSGFTMIRLNSFPGAGEVNINDIINAVSGRPVWVTHRYEASEEELAFLEGITDTYTLCRQLGYGQTSSIDYYIPAGSETENCTTDSNRN